MTKADFYGWCVVRVVYYALGLIVGFILGLFCA